MKTRSRPRPRRNPKRTPRSVRSAKEIERVPVEHGVYFIHGDKLEPVKPAESKVVSNTETDRVEGSLAAAAGLGQSDAGTDGDTASFHADPETGRSFISGCRTRNNFAIIKLTPKKGGARIVENIDIVPVSKEVIEERQDSIFKRQVGDLLFKIWPEEIWSLASMRSLNTPRAK